VYSIHLFVIEKKRKRNLSFLFLGALYIKQEKKRCEQGHHFKVLSLLFVSLFFIMKERSFCLGKGQVVKIAAHDHIQHSWLI
jgi:hypothetical protein